MEGKIINDTFEKIMDNTPIFNRKYIIFLTGNCQSRLLWREYNPLHELVVYMPLVTSMLEDGSDNLAPDTSTPHEYIEISGLS